jgi:hypothetical protein
MTMGDARPITRRQFVRTSLIVLVCAGAAYAAYFAHRLISVRYGWSRIANYGWSRGREVLSWSRGAHLTVEERLHRRFDFLDLDPAGVRRFVEDYQKHRGRIGRFAPPRYPDQEIYHRYLLSTDFFMHGGDESRTVSYMMFYDPYASPCWNPCRVAA